MNQLKEAAAFIGSEVNQKRIQQGKQQACDACKQSCRQNIFHRFGQRGIQIYRIVDGRGAENNKPQNDRSYNQ